MPLHELYRMSEGKVGHKEMNTACAADQSSAHKNDLFELVWENGQISVQGQPSSSRPKKSPTTCKSLPSHCLPSHSPRVQDKKDSGYANETNTRMGKFDNGMNEIARAEVGLSHDEEAIPWLNYGMDDSLQHEYSAGFLHELSGVAMNDLLPSNKFSLLDRSCNCNQVIRDSHKHSSRHVLSSEQGILAKGSSAETSGPKASTGQLYAPSLLHQCQPLFASVRSRESDIAESNTSNATQHAPCGEMIKISQIPSASSGFSSLKMERQDPNVSSNSSIMMNFSHFAKPAAMVKANLHSIALTSGLSSSRSESVGIKNKGAAATRINPPESTKVYLSGECPKKSAIHSQQALEPSKVDLKPLEPKSLEQDAAVSTPACKEDVSKVDQTSNQVHGESGRKAQEAVKKCMEPTVVSSSVCSGNGAERGSDGPNQNLKRKSRDTEDSECHSDDVEDESVDVKKAAYARGGMGSKRNRSAEVHNLSERRRRDRINEKMRALQELIPNCNKVDKASMLDEAIEYLKTLQLQLQIMSMGGGLYMPAMMLSAGMQHMHAPHMSPFSPMGVGMQMGLGVGYGMGMPDVNDGSSRFPMVQVPQLQGTHLPVAHTSGHTAIHGMARSNPQMFGLPAQGLPMQMPCAPIFSFPGESPMNPSAVGLNGCGTEGLMDTVEPASAPRLKDPMPNVNSQAMQNSNGCNITNKVSTQCEATTIGFEQSTLVLNNGHVSSANDKGAVNPGKEDKSREL